MKTGVIVLAIAALLIIWSSSYKSKERMNENHGSMETGDSLAPHNSTGTTENLVGKYL